MSPIIVVQVEIDEAEAAAVELEVGLLGPKALCIWFSLAIQSQTAHSYTIKASPLKQAQAWKRGKVKRGRVGMAELQDCSREGSRNISR